MCNVGWVSWDYNVSLAKATCVGLCLCVRVCVVCVCRKVCVCVIICVCVCVVCVCRKMGVFVCVCECVSVKARGQLFVFFLRSQSP